MSDPLAGGHWNLDWVPIDRIIATGARLIVGIVLSFVAGVLGFLFLWTVILGGARSETLLTVSVVTGVAAATGAGAFPAWLIPGFTRRSVAVLVAAALFTGLAGGWLGFLVGTPSARAILVDIQTGERIKFEGPVAELFTKPGIQSTWLGAAIGTNLILGGVYLYVALRTREY